MDLVHFSYSYITFLLSGHCFVFVAQAKGQLSTPHFRPVAREATMLFLPCYISSYPDICPAVPLIY